ncbi:hypothetical protein LEMLEM_LOCUS6276, partial [Lemmus lemmus]
DDISRYISKARKLTLAGLLLNLKLTDSPRLAGQPDPKILLSLPALAAVPGFLHGF